MNEFIRLVLLQDPNTRVVLAGAGLLGVCAGVLGVFVVLRRRALVGDAIAHAALPGIGASFLIFGERNVVALLAGAFVFGLLGVLCIAAIQMWTRVKEDAALGIVLSSFFGLGLVLSRIAQSTPGGNKAGLDGYIFGKAASMVQSDVLVIALVAVTTLVVVAFFFKELRLVCFDRSFAASIGRPVGMIDFVLLALVCVCVIAGLPAVGVVLTAALLIIPAAGARFWTDRLGYLVFIAGLFGAGAACIGVAMSAALPIPAGSRGWPTGAMIVLAAAAIFMVSMLLAPQRGVLAAVARRVAFKRKMSLEHVLRAAYEVTEDRKPGGFSWSINEIVRHIDGQAGLQRIINRAVRAGLVKKYIHGTRAGQYTLTDDGAIEATRLVRAHRLWEHFLIRHADIAPDHVHRGADELEHILPTEMIRAIELELGSTLPPAPPSPHQVVQGVRLEGNP